MPPSNPLCSLTNQPVRVLRGQTDSSTILFPEITSLRSQKFQTLFFGGNLGLPPPIGRTKPGRTQKSYCRMSSCALTRAL
jgi:hypothetical protein